MWEEHTACMGQMSNEHFTEFSPPHRHGVHGKSVLRVQDRKNVHVSAPILCTSSFSVLWFRIATSLTVLSFSVTFLRQSQVNVDSIV